MQLGRNAVWLTGVAWDARAATAAWFMVVDSWIRTRHGRGSGIAVDMGLLDGGTNVARLDPGQWTVARGSRLSGNDSRRAGIDQELVGSSMAEQIVGSMQRSR